MFQLVPNTPIELGFPEKFHRWRNFQPECVEKAITCTKRASANCAPTGFGKSQAYVAQAVLEGGRTCFLTGTKGLQDQLMSDYAPMGMVKIMGKDNYPCPSRPGWTCRDGFAGQCPLRGTPNCPHSQAYNTARTSDLVSTNYKYWVSIHRYGTGLGKFDRLVLDEAHTCPDEVAESMQVKLSFNEIQDMLEIDFPGGENPSGEVWKEWARKNVPVCRAVCLKKLNQIQSHRDPKATWMRDYHHLKNVLQKLGILALMKPTDWVWELFDWGWQFDPIKFARYTESRLFLGIPRLILYSATIRPMTLNMLGIKTADFEFHDWPAIFDPKRSPIYQIPTMRVDHRANGDYKMLGLRCDQIIGPRLAMKRNGIVHVTSFKYRDTILYNSHYRYQMISHFDNSPSSEAVQKFKRQGGVLISPSVGEGYDFPDDLCRFQIITKIPFRPKSKVISAREESDKLYGPYNATQGLVQKAGRGTRSEQDWCESAILDDHMFWFARRFEGLAPKAFWQRYSISNTIPPPLEVGR